MGTPGFSHHHDGCQTQGKDWLADKFTDDDRHSSLQRHVITDRDSYLRASNPEFEAVYDLRQYVFCVAKKRAAAGRQGGQLCILKGRMRASEAHARAHKLHEVQCREPVPLYRHALRCNWAGLEMTEPVPYRHTQTGKTIWLFLLVAVVGAFAAMAASGFAVTMILAFVVALLLLVGWLFGSLTVAIAGGAINWWFGPGVWKKRVAIDEIEVCETARNRWWWGWGIRYYGKGWLYNVSGLDAVEIRLKSGKHIRIGTDEPDALVMAIRNHPDRHTKA